MPALLEGGGGRDELGLGGPADLALDLLDEAVDPRRGAERLLPLEGDEGFLVLLVREVDLDETRWRAGRRPPGPR